MNNILITGAASGLGKAISQLYAEKGWRVLLVDIQDDLGQAFAQQLNNSGYLAEYYHCDIGQKNNFDQLVTEVSARHQHIDVLVNNAGVASAGTLQSTTEAEWQRLINLDLLSVIYGTQAFLPLLLKSQRAHIVSTASFAGIAQMPGMMSYNVTKAGVIAFSETLHGEMALHDIGVSVACPAFFQTNLVSSMATSSDKTKAFVDKQMKSSDVSAKDVARDIYQGVQKKRFMIISHRQSRMQYWVKRLAPGIFLNQKKKIFIKLMKSIKK